MTIKLQYRKNKGYDGDCDGFGLHIVNSTINLGTYYFKNIVDLQKTVENVTKTKYNYIKLWIYEDVNNNIEYRAESFKGIDLDDGIYEHIHEIPDIINLYEHNRLMDRIKLRDLQIIELSFCM